MDIFGIPVRIGNSDEDPKKVHKVREFIEKNGWARGEIDYNAPEYEDIHEIDLYTLEENILHVVSMRPVSGVTLSYRLDDIVIRSTPEEGSDVLFDGKNNEDLARMNRLAEECKHARDWIVPQVLQQIENLTPQQAYDVVGQPHEVSAETGDGVPQSEKDAVINRVKRHIDRFGRIRAEYVSATLITPDEDEPEYFDPEFCLPTNIQFSVTIGRVTVVLSYLPLNVVVQSAGQAEAEAGLAEANKVFPLPPDMVNVVRTMSGMRPSNYVELQTLGGRTRSRKTRSGKTKHLRNRSKNRRRQRGTTFRTRSRRRSPPLPRG